MISAQDWTALWITLKLAGLSTLILLVLATPLSLWLAYSRARSKLLIEALVALPLVLPPTVLGFYLLILLSPSGWVGGALEAMGLPALSFTFAGLVFGSVFYSLPFVVQPLQRSFESVGRRPWEVASTLGAGRADAFFTAILPQARTGYLTGAVLGFAHTLGEFGVVLMIGGNIPGRTQVVSMAIYDHVEALDYGRAHGLSALLLVLSFGLLLAVYALNRRFGGVRP